MKTFLKLNFLFFLFSFFAKAQSLPEIPFSAGWVAGMEKMAPSKTNFPSSKTHKILVFSLFTGFNHWVVPHSEAVIKTLASKTGAFEITITKDIAMFEKSALKQFDAVVLNNTCSIGDKRNIFWDVLKIQMPNDSLGAKKKAEELEKNLLSYVKKGGGLMILHGGIVMQNKSLSFGEMVGGNFFYHPKQQKITVKLVDVSHPMVQSFGGQDFVHVDEPYLFNNAYDKKNFRPLLYFNASEIEGIKEKNGDAIRYVSWIKKFGKGRVFYSSPSHNAQSYSDPRLLNFLLDGMQFVVGDVKCDMSPILKP